jgi:hypothetical protein
MYYEFWIHFGLQDIEATLWGPFSRAIVSGYIANKIKKAGDQKAARKTRNPALRKKHNPTPAAPTSHAIQRYKERGAASSPIYKSMERKS